MADGLSLPEDLDYSTLSSQLTVPTNLQELASQNQIGLVMLKIVEIIGEDNVDDLIYEIDGGDVILYNKIGRQVTFNAPPNFNGTENFTVTVEDSGGLITSQILTVTVDPINDAPIAYADNQSTDEDQSTSILLSGYDVDGDVLEYSITVPPQIGTIEIDGSNVTYTPLANLNGLDITKH